MKTKFKKFLRFGFYLPSTLLNRINYSFRRVKAGKGHETKGHIYIKNSGSIVIGKNVRINSSAKSNPIGVGNKTYFQVLKNAKLIIGDNTRMSNCAITSAESVTIGKKVRIGAGVKIYDTDFHSLNPYERTATPEKGKAKTKPVVISDYAFLGAGCYILKGVTVGKFSVVGAGAVVTKSIPDGEIWAGNPAVKVGELKEDMLREKI